MAETILLTGRPGCGKTTIIRKVVAEMTRPVGGFYTEEIRDASGRQGFRIVTLAGREGVLAHVRRGGKPRVGRYGVNLEALEALGVGAVEKAMAHGQIVILDEIGPMELKSQQFQQIVLEAIQSSSPVLGTISIRPSPLGRRVRSMANVRLIEVDESNRDELPRKILNLIDPGSHFPNGPG